MTTIESLYWYLLVVLMYTGACGACSNDNVATLSDIPLRRPSERSNFWDGGNDPVLSDTDVGSQWYRVAHDGEQYLMVDSNNKPHYEYCSTYYPIFLQGTHPSPEGLTETPVSAVACRRNYLNPCSITYGIKLRRCGNEVQYFLQSTQDYSAYCFTVRETYTTTEVVATTLLTTTYPTSPTSTDWMSTEPTTLTSQGMWETVSTTADSTTLDTSSTSIYPTLPDTSPATTTPTWDTSSTSIYPTLPDTPPTTTTPTWDTSTSIYPTLPDTPPATTTQQPTDRTKSSSTPSITTNPTTTYNEPLHSSTSSVSKVQETLSAFQTTSKQTSSVFQTTSREMSSAIQTTRQETSNALQTTNKEMSSVFQTTSTTSDTEYDSTTDDYVDETEITVHASTSKSTQSSNAEGQKGEGYNTNIIIIMAAGMGILAVTIIGLVACLLLRRRKSKANGVKRNTNITVQEEEHAYEMPVNVGPVDSGNSSNPYESLGRRSVPDGNMSQTVYATLTPDEHYQTIKEECRQNEDELHYQTLP